MRRHRPLRPSLCLLALAGLLALSALAGCGEDDPEATPVSNNDGNNANNSANNVNNVTNNATNNGTEDVVPAECILPTDYSPGAEDTWDACISDDGAYHAFGMSLSSAGRTAAFEELADLLWRNGAPSANDFLDAREIYAVDEGIDSRLQRREDLHYPKVSDGAGGTLACSDAGVPAMGPERCVGPALMLPILNDAFQQGAMGNDPEINAARIEATLAWFFYVSVFKEATTCASKAADCDSSYAYYTGDFGPDEAIGLAAAIRGVSPAANTRVWDGVLALRCWRDLDSAEVATDTALRDQALAQMDRALLYGLSRLIIDRAEHMMGASGAAQQADLAWLKILGPVLDRELRIRDAASATALATEWRRPTRPSWTSTPSRRRCSRSSTAPDRASRPAPARGARSTSAAALRIAHRPGQEREKGWSGP